MATHTDTTSELIVTLPDELLQRIASNMDLWDRARSAAPTCKKLWNLQLLNIGLNGDLAGMFTQPICFILYSTV